MEPTQETLKFCHEVISKILENPTNLYEALEQEKLRLDELIPITPPGIMESVLEGHAALCAAKNMGLREAYGHDPAVFYGLALAGECGELANKLIRVIRINGSQEEKKKAIESEIADVIIYAIILAFTSGIHLRDIVKEKCDVVVKRANDGYYGGPIVKDPAIMK